MTELSLIKKIFFDKLSFGFKIVNWPHEVTSSSSQSPIEMTELYTSAKHQAVLESQEKGYCLIWGI